MMFSTSSLGVEKIVKIIARKARMVTPIRKKDSRNIHRLWIGGTTEPIILHPKLIKIC